MLLSVYSVLLSACAAPLNVAITTLVTHRPNLNGAKNKHWLLKRPHLFPWGDPPLRYIHLPSFNMIQYVHKQLDPLKSNMREKLSTALAQLLLSIGNDTFFL